MWYLNKNNNAINLDKIISAKIFRKGHKFEIITSDNRVILEIYDSFEEANNFIKDITITSNKNEGIKMYWYTNKDNVAINLSQIIMLKMREQNNIFVVYAYDTYTKYILEKFSTLEEANDFIKAITDALNGNNTNNKLGYAFSWLK